MSSSCTPILVGVVFFGFGDMAIFQKRPNFPFGAWTKSMIIKKFDQSELAQKIHASRD